MVLFERTSAKNRTNASKDAWRKVWAIEQPALYISLPDGSIYALHTQEIKPSKLHPTPEMRRKSQEILERWQAVEDAAFYFNSQGILAFRSYPCQWDCSGHKAGYEWAEDKDIDEYADCRGNSQSFVQGCKVYVADQKSDVIPQE